MADQGSEGLLSPLLRRRRINAVRPYLNGRILDVGCGSGALAGMVPPERYLGIDTDAISLKTAASTHAAHRFQNTFPVDGERFDTVVSLAVIEHVKDPEQFLGQLARQLLPAENSRLVLTTPHPSTDWIHDFGATIGLFSKHANEEHEQLLDHARLRSAGADCGLRMVHFERFLFGVHQLAVFAVDGVVAQ